MTRLSQLVGQPTISLADAEQGGRVEGVQIEGGRVIGLRTSDGLIETAAIRTFDGDAVTYDGPSVAADTTADSPLGRRVLSEQGDELGRLADLDITDDGTVTSVLLDDGRGLDGASLKVVGSYAVIVAAPPDPSTGSELPPPPASASPA